eukprot:gene4568-9079_t
MGCRHSKTTNPNFHSILNPEENAEEKDRVQETKKRRCSQSITENMVHEEMVRDIHEFYTWTDGRVLGTGISGMVCVCTHRQTLLKYALKTLDKRKVKPANLSTLKLEIRFMAQLDHPNIVRLHECFETQHEIYLVMELCTGGELLDRLQNQPEHYYTEHVACKLVHTILGAVRFCHERHIVHRDLKLENFLFENESPDSELKLIDFGLSQHFEPDQVLKNPVGTPYYVAPEVLKGAYDASCDIWSIGVVAYMLLSGSPPFFGNNDQETLVAVKRGRYVFHTHLFEDVSDNAKDFIASCLQMKPSLRPTAEQAQHHPWFASLSAAPAPVSLDILGRLRAFQKKSTLSRLCLEAVAHTLSTEQIKDLRQEFVKYDKEESGYISFDNLRQILQEYEGLYIEEIGFIFTGIDLEHTGHINYHEFIAATITKNHLKEENMKLAFEKMSNHHEFITAADIRDLLGRDSTDEEVDQMLRDMNFTPTSQISYTQMGHTLFTPKRKRNSVSSTGSGSQSTSTKSAVGTPSPPSPTLSPSYRIRSSEDIQVHLKINQKMFTSSSSSTSRRKSETSTTTSPIINNNNNNNIHNACGKVSLLLFPPPPPPAPTSPSVVTREKA